MIWIFWVMNGYPLEVTQKSIVEMDSATFSSDSCSRIWAAISLQLKVMPKLMGTYFFSSNC